MKCWSGLTVAMALVLAFTTPCRSQDADQGPSFQEQFDQWLPGMGAEKIADRRDSQQKLQELVFKLGVPGREKELADACTIIATKLGPDVANPARIWLLRQLEFNGRGECVETVAALLDDKDPLVRDAARRALQNNPVPEANAKLLAALAASGDAKWKLALCNSLGYRGDATSADALVKLLADKDEAVASAAGNALGKIGGDRAAEALSAAEAKASGKLQVCFCDAYLRCADKVLAAGDAAKAIGMYDRLSKPDKPRVIRIAATQGKLNAVRKK